MDHKIDTGVMSQSRPSHSRYPATSSAFSASAHPHEDWTKIADLAERRRIQNRIAQRNYRKKLKRRLEDLERKASSTSASPEQLPAQLSQQKSSFSRKSGPSSTSSTSSQKSIDASPQLIHQQSLSAMIPPDATLFVDQYSRSISTSPSPVFSFPMTASDTFELSAFTTAMQYPTISASYDPLGFSYAPLSTEYPSAAAASYPTKTEFYPDIDINNFTFQYASTPITNADSKDYNDILPQTPPLSDCHELYIAGSPSESSFLPQTPPMAYEISPPLTMV